MHSHRTQQGFLETLAYTDGVIHISCHSLLVVRLHLASPDSYCRVATEEMQDYLNSSGQPLETHTVLSKHGDMARSLDTVVLGTVEDTSGALVVELFQMQVTDSRLQDVSPRPVNRIAHKPGALTKNNNIIMFG